LARFAPTILQLTSFWVQAPERFTAFQKHMAQAYIVTRNTPPGLLGFPTPDKLRDSSAWLVTDNVTFHLDTDNSVVAASALGLIYDGSATAANREDVMRTLDFAVYDDEGTVLATHREVQLYGGNELDEDAIQESVLNQARSASDVSLMIVPVDLSSVPSDMPIRIDPRTQRILAPES
jgi:hypothetical protein